MLGTSTSGWGTQAVMARVSGCTGVRNVPVRTQDSTSSTAACPRRRTSSPTDPATTVSFVTNRQGVFDTGVGVAGGCRGCQAAPTAHKTNRFIGDDLILLDTHAHIIVDFIEDALPK
jgi:hypothetical protein